jgi:hypothetical protein
MVLGAGGLELFSSLRDEGVVLERVAALPRPGGGAGFDLILEDRTRNGAAAGLGRIHPLLAPGGRFVVVLERKRWLGLSRRRVLRRVRREGFATVETFHAYPSLRAPRILVPLDRPEPFRYFLDLAAGVRAPRQRLLALAARCLCALRLHRALLPNLIVVARRSA